MSDLVLTSAQLEAIGYYRDQCRQSGWRGMVHIAGDVQWVRSIADQLVQSLCLITVPVSGDMRQLQNRLGSECEAVMLDAFAGFSPNALGMIAACLQAGGLFIVLSPPLAQWPDFADPDYQRMLSVVDNGIIAGRFLRRCAAFLQRYPQRVFITANGFEVPLLPDLPLCQPDLTGQQQLIAAVKKVAVGHARRPLVLSADRGRGKSAALGMACAELMQERPMAIAVCSVSPLSVATLFQYLADTLGLPAGKTEYYFQQSHVVFYPVDRLLAAPPDCQLLVIDEAAAIPTALLQQCLHRFNRIVFATTLNGYEGNGRGFEIRFLPLLRSAMPQYRHLTLDEPLRWRRHDPLERWVNRLLLLDTDDNVVPPESVADTPLQVESVNRDQLLADEPLLRQIFSVLVLAHYQTSPDDLRLLLDHPDVQLFIVRQHHHVMAAALLMREGGFSEHWQQKLQQGRRCGGHLLPQALLGDGFAELLDKQFWRVLRIAVHPQCQQQGVGSLLLQQLISRVQGDFLGASFSAEPAVIRFWQKAGFVVCRLGSRKESATGQYACIVLRAVSDEARHHLPVIRQQFARHITTLLLTHNHDIAVDTVPWLLKALPVSAEPRDFHQCQAYCSGYRSLEQVFGHVRQVLLVHLAAIDAVSVSPVLLEKVLLNHSWQSLAERYKLSGRKAVEQLMRMALQQIVNH